MTVAVERGDIDVNPCKQVKRNLERPRTEAPEPETLDAFIAWLSTQDPQRKVVAMMADLAAMAGSRRVEFLHLTLPQIDSQAQTIRLMRAKQHGGAVCVESVSITERGWRTWCAGSGRCRAPTNACMSSQPGTVSRL